MIIPKDKTEINNTISITIASLFLKNEKTPDNDCFISLLLYKCRSSFLLSRSDQQANNTSKTMLAQNKNAIIYVIILCIVVPSTLTNGIHIIKTNCKHAITTLKETYLFNLCSNIQSPHPCG